MIPILQDYLREMPWMSPVTARLPGIQPLAPDTWIRIDEAYGAQMALRDQLIAQTPDTVHALLPEALEPAQELLEKVLGILAGMPEFQLGPTHVTRPDGVRVNLDYSQPLLTLGRLVQEDFVVHLHNGTEHAVMGAILCFPASWTLAQKIGKPLTAVHVPVPEYDEGVAKRVQRLFDALRPEQPLWRANALLYDDPTLHQPRLEGESRPRPFSRDYMRTERQCLLRLEKSRAVIFAIHTTIVHVDNLPPEALDAFRALHPEA